MPDNQITTCFIDTNVWLYAFIEADDTAKSVTACMLIQETEPVVSTQVINEVCVNLLRQANFTEEQVSQLIESFYEKYPVIELNRSVLLTCLLDHGAYLHQGYHPLFYHNPSVKTLKSPGPLYRLACQSGILWYTSSHN